MVKFLIINVTSHMPQNKVNEDIMHVTLKTINGEITINFKGKFLSQPIFTS